MSWVRIPLVTLEEILDNQMIIEDFSFYATFYYSRNRQKSLKISLISTLLITVYSPIVSLKKTNRNTLTIRGMQAYHNYLKRNNYKHEYHTTHGGHQWYNWKEYCNLFMQRPWK